MSILGDDLLLFDTNILVHWIRQDRTGQHLMSHYSLEKRPERPLISTISEGEILGLAKYWKWGNNKLTFLEAMLKELVRFEASLPEVIDAYSTFYFEDKKSGRNTGENDLWIAACAKATNAILLTCDQDFLWLHPSFIRVEYIPEIK